MVVLDMQIIYIFVIFSISQSSVFLPNVIGQA